MTVLGETVSLPNCRFPGAQAQNSTYALGLPSLAGVQLRLPALFTCRLSRLREEPILCLWLLLSLCSY